MMVTTVPMSALERSVVLKIPMESVCMVKEKVIDFLRVRQFMEPDLIGRKDTQKLLVVLLLQTLLSIYNSHHPLFQIL